MAEFQHMDGSKLPSPSTSVVGSVLRLKLIPGPKEPLPTITAFPETVAKITHLEARQTANFATFHLEAVAVGAAVLQATGGPTNGALAQPVAIVVENRVTLPAAATDEGLFVRLFLAETPSPEASGYTLDDASTAMTWMRVVLQNRLAKPSAVWGSAGAATLSDVVKAHNQFEGFSHYPTLPRHIQRNIEDAIAVANDGDDPRRASYKAFVDAALAAAGTSKVTDPSTAGLYWWRTSGSGKPTPEAKLYMTKLGNTFYTP